MQEIDQEQVQTSLRALGITSGDGLLVHSAVQFLGKPVGGIGMYLDALMEVIGPQGTLAVPAFNFGFAQGEAYDPKSTPSAGMGAFSEFVRQNPLSLRTTHPMQSLAIIGQHAADLAHRDTPSAFDPGSAFERMLHLDFKLLLLGADERAVSILHYSEQRFQVPYRYWKEFTGKVRRAGQWEDATYRMYVRDLELNPQLTLAPVRQEMEKQGTWKSTKVNYGLISACWLKDFVSTVDQFLSSDPWALVTNLPEGKQKLENLQDGTAND